MGAGCRSSGCRATRDAKKCLKKEQLWGDEQRRRRRLCRGGSADDFKRRIDELLDDRDGNESTLLPIQAKKGRARWLWSSRRLKGAVEIQEPTGEVFIRGNQEQQLYLIEFLRQFTEEWDGDIPKPHTAAKQKWQSLASAGSCMNPKMAEPSGGLQSGVFARVSDMGKFGFIKQDSGVDDMFVLPLGLSSAFPTVGQRVTYEVCMDTKTGRPRAQNVRPEGAAPSEKPDRRAASSWQADRDVKGDSSWHCAGSSSSWQGAHGVTWDSWQHPGTGSPSSWQAAPSTFTFCDRCPGRCLPAQLQRCEVCPLAMCSNKCSAAHYCELHPAESWRHWI